MTQIRFDHPTWIPENCTACGDCYTLCPDSAIPGLVNSMSEVFETTIGRIEKNGRITKHLRRAVRSVEKKLRELIVDEAEEAKVNELLAEAINDTLTETEGEEKNELATEFDWFEESLGDFKFAITKPYYSNREKRDKNSGGLFSITINPYTCKGCMECVTVCDDNALFAERQTNDTVERLRTDWEYWLDLPTTSKEFSRIDDLDEKIGALETLLLDKHNYNSMDCGDGACLGCGEKTALHIFVGTVTALMQQRVVGHVNKLEDLIQKLDNHIRVKLAETVNLSDGDAVNQVVAETEGKDLTLSRLSAGLDEGTASTPLDREWLTWAMGLLDQLKDLRWKYVEGITGKGRSELGIVNATGCTSVWGATFPYNPYPFPWTSHLF
ncbi:hypothetical protein BOW53_16115 [Solemya pervernicosa gill symbiont]|uniref:4Fe-4S ferredoxin-type domain-containing protein n=1 Tax=Solemya pervernicosa gill symbiont TaxID=642797 RepID=A0A1T2KZM8_9GAMM|nr:hypothetical protein BOW53_16115 [Solemya pervernicosa gill symbiont]